jgi:hypothetical protein
MPSTSHPALRSHSTTSAQSSCFQAISSPPRNAVLVSSSGISRSSEFTKTSLVLVARSEVDKMTPRKWATGIEKWSGRLDLNQRPHAPQACALPGCATSRPRETTTKQQPRNDSHEAATITKAPLRASGFPACQDALNCVPTAIQGYHRRSRSVKKARSVSRMSNSILRLSSSATLSVWVIAGADSAPIAPLCSRR